MADFPKLEKGRIIEIEKVSEFNTVGDMSFKEEDLIGKFEVINNRTLEFEELKENKLLKNSIIHVDLKCVEGGSDKDDVFYHINAGNGEDFYITIQMENDEEINNHASAVVESIKVD